jgi:hypothetical protein
VPMHKGHKNLPPARGPDLSIIAYSGAGVLPPL